jgi:hypothetical protein
MTADTPPEGSFDEFVAFTDPAVSVWLNAQSADSWQDRDLRMAAAFGELRALYQIYETWREGDGDMCFSRVFDTYVNKRDALARRRNSLDFAGLLLRHIEDDGGDDAA